MNNNGSSTAEVVIPPVPFEKADGFNIDEMLIASVASNYCTDPSEEVSAVYFFLGYLPLWSADGFCVETRERAYIDSLIGNFIVSGFFGGVWLRDEIKLNAFRGRRMRDLFENVHRGAMKIFEYAIGKLTNVALEGSGRSVRMLTRLSIEPFLILDGYNCGYFNYIMKNPPKGAHPPARYLELQKRFLDCRMHGVQIDVLEKYKPVLDRLYSGEGWSKGRRWSEMKAAASIWKGFSAATGGFVWRIIMNESMPVPVYELLLELSARFLLIAELCILPAMKCYAENDIDAGRTALLQQAGMIAWGGSYMVGLTSDMPEGTFPVLDFN